MIVDKIENLHQYSALGINDSEILKFIKLYETTDVCEGRYDILGEDLFALVMEYTTKDGETSRAETHVKHMDLQYVAKGHETILWELVDYLEIEEDKTPEEDLIFYKKTPDKTNVVLEEGMFALLLPEDAHTPCLNYKAESKVSKIVFKIKI